MSELIFGDRVDGPIADAAAESAGYVATRHLERKAAKGVRYAAREVEAARQTATAAKVAKGAAAGLAAANLVVDPKGCW